MNNLKDSIERIQKYFLLRTQILSETKRAKTMSKQTDKIIHEQLIELYERTNTLLELMTKINELDTNMRERMDKVEEILNVS